MSKLSREGNYINEATFISTWNQMNKAHHTNNREIKSALHICQFRICGFDQLQVENIKKKKKKSRKFQKAKLDFVPHWQLLMQSLYHISYYK